MTFRKLPTRNIVTKTLLLDRDDVCFEIKYHIDHDSKRVRIHGQENNLKWKFILASLEMHLLEMGITYKLIKRKFK